MRWAWGTIPEVFAAIGTVGALVATSWAVHQNSRTQVREQYDAEWDQAQAVTIGATSTQGPIRPDGYPSNLIGVSIHNQGRRGIYKLDVTAMANGKLLGLPQSLPDVPSGAVGNLTWPWNDDAFGPTGFSGDVVVFFNDVAGRRWMKDLVGHLIPDHRSPTSTRRSRRKAKREITERIANLRQSANTTD